MCQAFSKFAQPAVNGSTKQAASLAMNSVSSIVNMQQHGPYPYVSKSVLYLVHCLLPTPPDWVLQPAAAQSEKYNLLFAGSASAIHQ